MNTRAKATESAAALLVLAVYVLALAFIPRHVFWSPDEGGKLIQSQSVSWRGADHYELAYPGRTIDPNFEFFANERTLLSPRRLASGEWSLRLRGSLAFGLLNQPVYAVFGATGLYLIPLLCGWLSAVVSGRIMRSLDPQLSPLTVVVVGFATPVAFYSLTFWEHTAATLFSLIGVWFVVRYAADRPLSLLPALAATLAAAMFRVEALAVTLACFAAWIVAQGSRVGPGWASAESSRRFRPGPTLAAIAASGLTVGLFFASLSARHSGMLWSIPTRLLRIGEGLPFAGKSIAALAVDSDVGNAIVAPYFGAVMAIALAALFLLSIVARGFAARWIELAALAAVVVLCGALATSPEPYRALHGIFAIAPFLVLWPSALAAIGRRGDEPVTRLGVAAISYLAIGTAAVLYAYAKPFGLKAGLEWGPRYLLPVFPILTILTLAGISRRWHAAEPRLPRTALILAVSLLITLGVAFQARGYSMVRSERQKLAAWTRALDLGLPVVTDVWWLRSAVAPLFLRQPMFFVEERNQVSRWLELAARNETSRFAFASFGPVDASEFGPVDLCPAAAGPKGTHGLRVAVWQTATAGGGCPAIAAIAQ